MSRLGETGVLAVVVVIVACGKPPGGHVPGPDAPVSPRDPGPLPTAFDQTIPGTTATIHLVPIPALPGGGAHFLMSASEVTWDVYDAFALRLDEPETRAADAITRPSKPYLPPDRGWGHAGYAAM